jgi:broad specificity phosphatase PhoE
MRANKRGHLEPPAGENWLILVKHSFPDIIPGVRPSQWSLSKVGRQRCEPLAKELAVFQSQRVFSSIEPKAMETAHLVSQKLSIPFQSFEDLHEHLRKATLNFSEKLFHTKIAAFFAQPDELIYGEETAGQCRERFAKAVNILLNQNHGLNLIVVAHGTVITLFVAQACSIDPFPFWQRLGLPSFVVLSYPTLSMHSVVEQIA